MKKIFLDSDVLLDLLLSREPFVDDVAAIIEYALSFDIRICVSPLTITNIDYVIGRLKNRQKATLKRKQLLQIVQIENVGQSTIHQASSSAFKDFEDAVQNYCAAEANHQIIITRNTKDYKESNLSILTPKEYLAKIENEK